MDELTRQRTALGSARLRFAPGTQNLRDAAIEKIIERVLLVQPPDAELSLPQVEIAIDQSLGVQGAIRRSDIRNALHRLVQADRMTARGETLEGRTYRLAPRAREQLHEAAESARVSLDSIVRRLFSGAPRGHRTYREPFFFCVSRVFAELAGSYVQLLRGDLQPSEFALHEIVKEASHEAASRYHELNAGLFGRGISRFLTERDPEFDLMKWQLAQNHYLLKVLGLDPGGLLLSKEVLGRAILYLDTNVVIAALLPGAEHHRRFRTLVKSCVQLEISLRVCQVTVEELKLVLNYEFGLIQRVEAQIPSETAERVSSLFFRQYHQAKEANSSTTLTDFFEQFSSPSTRLNELYGVELLDDSWFVETSETREIRRLADQIRREQSRRRPERPKRERAALHDSLLISWVEQERKEEDRPVWVLTLDTGLPSFVPSEGDQNPLAITVDGLMQWLSPLAGEDMSDEDFAAVFAEAIRHELLPPDRMFALEDFLIFSELEWSCKDLPSDDVEDCIDHVRRAGIALDPSTPENREKLEQSLRRFFADPGRKHNAIVQSYSDQLEEKTRELEKLSRRLDEEHRARLAAEELRRREAAERAEEHRRLEGKVGERDEQAAALEARIQQIEAEVAARETRRERRSIVVRLVLWLTLSLGLFSVAGLVSVGYGDGENLVQRVSSVWWVFAVAASLSLILGWAILGHRTRKVGHVFRRILREE